MIYREISTEKAPTITPVIFNPRLCSINSPPSGRYYDKSFLILLFSASFVFPACTGKMPTLIYMPRRLNTELPFTRLGHKYLFRARQLPGYQRCVASLTARLASSPASRSSVMMPRPPGSFCNERRGSGFMTSRIRNSINANIR